MGIGLRFSHRGEEIVRCGALDRVCASRVGPQVALSLRMHCCLQVARGLQFDFNFNFKVNLALPTISPG